VHWQIVRARPTVIATDAHAGDRCVEKNTVVVRAARAAIEITELKPAANAQ